jgi:hypothetical protein
MSSTNERPTAIGEILAGTNRGFGSSVTRAGQNALAVLQTVPSAIVSTLPKALTSTVQQAARPLFVSAPQRAATSSSSFFSGGPSWFGGPSTASTGSSWFSSTSARPTTGSSWFTSTPTAALSTSSAGSSWFSVGSMFSGSQAKAQENMALSSYWLNVTYYFMLYSFIIFLILMIINYTITPVFSMYPGSPGVIPIPGATNDLVYWKKKTQPPFSDPVPKQDDKLYGKSYVNMFSYSIDIYLTDMTNSNPNTRLILYKSSAPITAPDPVPTTTDAFIDYMKTRASMMMYLTNTNDLVVTIFSSSPSGDKRYNSAPIKNVPLFTPFRITVVVEDRMFTTYLNGKQVFQRIVTDLIQSPSGLSGMQLFYSSPEWTNTPNHTIYIQNFHLWSRPITYKEIVSASPSLALVKDFGVSPDSETKCVTDTPY